MTLERRPEERALDRLILELREQSSPELDWDRVEARLLREPAPEAGGVSWLSRLRLPAAGLLAAAAVVTAVVARRPAAVSMPAPAHRTAKLSTDPLDGDRLALGAHVTAGAQPLVVQHRGRALWTLEPHASASVVNAGEFLTLRLESGAVSATVVPNPKPETFAIEVEGTRVAVHGTAFRVERAGDRVLVAVSEGTVAVEPAGVHSAPAFLLRRDSRGNFGLDGHSGSVRGNASAVVNDSSVQSHRQVARAGTLGAARPTQGTEPASAAAPSAVASSAPVAPAEAPAASELPVQPSISDIETGVSSALVLMNRCFRDKTASSENRVSASTGLTLTVTGEGAVASVTFAPPVAPAVEDCAVNGLRSLTFAHSVEGVTFTRVLELTR